MSDCLLERCLTEIIRRHEAWRSSFDTVDGQAVQLIHPAPAETKIPFVVLLISKVGLPASAKQKLCGSPLSRLNSRSTSSKAHC